MGQNSIKNTFAKGTDSTLLDGGRDEIVEKEFRVFVSGRVRTDSSNR